MFLIYSDFELTFDAEFLTQIVMSIHLRDYRVVPYRVVV